MLGGFLRQLFEDGVITLAAGAPEEDEDAVDATLSDAEARHRLNLPGEPPAWDSAVGRWASRLLYDACRALVHREIESEEVARTLSTPPPSHGTPSAHYSADVPFRALPDVLRLARGVSPDDPLTIRLLDVARTWPLSSVGVAHLGPLDITGFIDDLSLRRTYVQRIVHHNDFDRLDDERVRLEVRSLLGAYPSLAPAVARRLEGVGL
jgi:hypothetical protein